MERDKPTSVELTRAEALVLFEWLPRIEADNVAITQDHAEQIALWALSGALERVLVEPFHEDYGQIIDQARRHLTSET